MRARPGLVARGLAVVLGLASFLGGLCGTTLAAFGSSSSSSDNTFSAAPDWTAPSAARSVIAPAAGGAAGTIEPGQAYHVYAEVNDAGDPPAGVASVTADVSAVSSGQTVAALEAGSWTVEGQTYNRRSPALTADDPLAAGSKSYSISSADSASPPNARTQTGYSVIVPDPPSVAAAVIQKSAGGDAGHLKQGGGYYVYADVAGATTVTADVGSITAGRTAAALTAGSYAVGGVTYTHRSALITADNPLSEGSRLFSITATEGSMNVTEPGYSVTVDNAGPSASDVQTANGAATARKAEQGDTVTYTFSEPIEPITILAGWSGAATNVVVRLVNGGAGNDTLTVWNATNTQQLALGSINLGRKDYTSTNGLNFGLSGTPSTMVRSGASVTVTLGTPNVAGATLAAGTGTMSWTPSTAATDRAGNSASGLARSEAGTADGEF